jgi:hypothetical protein
VASGRWNDASACGFGLQSRAVDGDWVELRTLLLSVQLNRGGHNLISHHRLDA